MGRNEALERGVGNETSRSTDQQGAEGAPVGPIFVRTGGFQRGPRDSEYATRARETNGFQNFGEAPKRNTVSFAKLPKIGYLAYGGEKGPFVITILVLI